MRLLKIFSFALLASLSSTVFAVDVNTKEYCSTRAPAQWRATYNREVQHAQGALRVGNYDRARYALETAYHVSGYACLSSHTPSYMYVDRVLTSRYVDDTLSTAKESINDGDYFMALRYLDAVTHVADVHNVQVPPGALNYYRLAKSGYADEAFRVVDILRTRRDLTEQDVQFLSTRERHICQAYVAQDDSSHKDRCATYR